MGLDARTDAGAIGAEGAGNRGVDLAAAPVAIEVRGVEKIFRIPTHQISRLKERVVHPLARQEYRLLHALNDVSFDIRKGEFFGIVGRNGSGKSTLMKVMASIYEADAGTVRMAGQVAPFIELGVGFDMELTARENIVLNAVMMGLTPKEARRNVDAVLEFAELEEFDELKLKNYSSGMLVRLGFSVMVQADTDILLIDEVLAVGDAAFQQKCADSFHRMRNEGKTIILVTHSMAAVEQYCDRAMLLKDGRIVEIGVPRDVARRYMRLNFEDEPDERGDAVGASETTEDVRLVDVWLEGADGDRVTNVEQGEQIRLRALVEARRPVPGALFGFVIFNANDIAVHEFGGQPTDSLDVGAGQSLTVALDSENRLSPGRYYVLFGASRNQNRNDLVLTAPHVLGFVVFGDQETGVVASAEHDFWLELRTDGSR